MNMETFGRNLMEIIAERSLAMLRSTSADDVRRMMNGQVPAALSPSSERSTIGSFVTAAGAFVAGAAIGVGVTALYAPTSGDELRKKIGRGASDARKQAMQMGDDVRGRIDEARASIIQSVEHVGSAASLASPTPAPKRRRKSTKSSAMNGHAPHARAKKPPHGRPHHDA
jgi:hypothetical protein